MVGKIENINNHVTLVIDASLSMTSRKSDLIKVVDSQVKYLAERSKIHGQETRISIYQFNETVRNLVWDMDVLRLPSIADLYRPQGMTALRDATSKAISDYRQIPQQYGDHGFITYLVTDGEENASRYTSTSQLNKLLTTLPDNETVAVLVPDQDAVFEAKRFGFPANNIAIWNPNKADGVSEAMNTVNTSMENFMVARKSGVRSSKDIFNMGTEVLNSSTVKSTLKPLPSTSYMLIPVLPKYHRVEIPEFLAENGLPFSLGKVFYQIAKREEVQPHKQVAVLEKKTGRVYTGPQARQLVKLPDFKTRIGPQDNPDYTIFIQSTAPNRKLDASTKDVKSTQLLLMK